MLYLIFFEQHQRRMRLDVGLIGIYAHPYLRVLAVGGDFQKQDAVAALSQTDHFHMLFEFIRSEPVHFVQTLLLFVALAKIIDEERDSVEALDVKLCLRGRVDLYHSFFSLPYVQVLLLSIPHLLDFFHRMDLQQPRTSLSPRDQSKANITAKVFIWDDSLVYTLLDCADYISVAGSQDHLHSALKLHKRVSGPLLQLYIKVGALCLAESVVMLVVKRDGCEGSDCEDQQKDYLPTTHLLKLQKSPLFLLSRFGSRRAIRQQVLCPSKRSLGVDDIAVLADCDFDVLFLEDCEEHPEEALEFLAIDGVVSVDIEQVEDVLNVVLSGVLCSDEVGDQLDDLRELGAREAPVVVVVVLPEDLLYQFLRVQSDALPGLHLQSVSLFNIIQDWQGQP